MSAPSLAIKPQDLPTFGRVGYLTPEQQSTLNQFTVELKEASLFNQERHDDHTLLRFLRARKFQLPAAGKMIADYGTYDFIMIFMLKQQYNHCFYSTLPIHYYIVIFIKIKRKLENIV